MFYALFFMTINIIHRNMELTPSIREYVEEKIRSLDKYEDDIRHADVEVGLVTQHHNKGNIFECKVVLSVGGDALRIEREAEDLYKSIDKVRDHLRMELIQRKEKRTQIRDRE